MIKMTDATGQNELMEGDLVVCRIGSDTLLGRVAKISGGLSVVSPTQKSFPQITIMFVPYTIQCLPDKNGNINTVLGTVYKMHDPTPPAAQ